MFLDIKSPATDNFYKMRKFSKKDLKSGLK